ncbi:MAG: hypothetical protein GC159_21235 [Phycisphaera sp.]|nr:hypothetical protein [Phycisphaera sp.]
MYKHQGWWNIVWNKPGRVAALSTAMVLALGVCGGAVHGADEKPADDKPAEAAEAKPAENTDTPSEEKAMYEEHAMDGDHGHPIAGPFGIFLTPEQRTSRISDAAVVDVQADPRMKRPKPIIELGNPFLGSGNIGRGIEMPGGSVWQPSLLVFGQYRSAIQAFNDGRDTYAEWANSLDIFGNIQLTGTERVVVGFNPLAEDGRFSGYEFSPDFNSDDWKDATNAGLTTLFFEGDLGEIFSDLDPADRKSIDLGFSVGRQPIVVQDGMLINDTMDSIGIIRNTLLPPGGTDLQVTFLYAWGDIDRNDNRQHDGTHLLGMFWAADYPFSTINADFVYVIDADGNDDGFFKLPGADEGSGDGFFWGLSGVQRIGQFNTTLRALGSHAIKGESVEVHDGYLFFGELSWTPAWTHDNVYVNGFVGIDEFSSAARGPTAGGPLGRTGVLFAALGLGRYGAPLGNRADNSYGGAIGYQWFIDEQARKQLLVEFGGRNGYSDDQNDGQIALGARYQQAIGQHMVLQFDTFGSLNEGRDPGYGGRVEIRVDF